MPGHEFEKRCTEEPPEPHRMTEVLRANARLREIPECLHEEDDILERDPRVRIVPKPRVGTRPHEHQHVAASEETRDLDVHLASDEVVGGCGEVGPAR